MMWVNAHLARQTFMQVPLLSLGSKGARVRELEQKLKEQGFLKGPVDNVFDKRTERAVVAYKLAHVADHAAWANNPKPVAGRFIAQSLGLTPPRDASTPGTLRGGTYNVHVTRTPASAKAAVTKILKEQNLDFLQLQEISRFHKELRSIPGYKLITFPGAKDHGESGVLVREGLKLDDREVLQSKGSWSSPDGAYRAPRAAAAVKVAGWLNVVSLHAPPAVDWKNGQPVGPERRIKSYQSLSRELVRYARRNEGEAVLLGGDWNEGARSTGVGSPSWVARQAGMQKHPSGHIDWAMSRGAKVNGVKVHGKYGSDHHLVTYTVKQSQQPPAPKKATVRAMTFNWPSRYKKGGEAADEALFDKLSAQADVMGLQEFSWGNPRITDNEKDWAFYNPNPPGDGDNKRVGQVLAWNKKVFSLVEQGTSPLSPKTAIQPEAAGPTLHRGKHIVWAKLRHKETGEVFTIAVVHFVPSKHLGGAAQKLWVKQRDNLAKWLKAQGPRTVVLGDFNGQWSDSIAKPLHEVAKGASAPSHGKRAIDLVLRSKDLGGGPAKALSNEGQSDHRPVVATVRG